MESALVGWIKEEEREILILEELEKEENISEALKKRIEETKKDKERYEEEIRKTFGTYQSGLERSESEKQFDKKNNEHTFLNHLKEELEN